MNIPAKISGLLAKLLHPDYVLQSVEKQFRARVAAASMLLVTITCGTDLFYATIGSASWHVFMWSSLIFALALSFLLQLRLFLNYERTLACFTICYMLVVGIKDFNTAKTSMLSALYFYPFFTLQAFLICDKRWAIIVAAWSILEGSVLLWLSSHVGLHFSHFMPFEQAMTRRAFYLAVTNFEIFLCMLIFHLLTQWARKQLHREKDWFLRSAKLQELSSWAHTASSQLAQPLSELRRTVPLLFLKHRQAQTPALDLDKQLFQRVEQNIQSMVKISRSLGWLYRSQRSETQDHAAMNIYMDQLRLLLEFKATERNWSLHFEADPRALVLEGPLGSLMLLLVTLCQGVMDFYQVKSAKHLAVEVVHKDALIYWLISWPEEAKNISEREGAGPFADMERQIRETFLRELIRECKATLKESKEKNEYILLLGQEWTARERESIASQV